jgi:hypothetical protein
MSTAINSSLIDTCIERLQLGYQTIFDARHPEYSLLLGKVATTTLNHISRSTAAYHNIEHTVLVALVGQEILHGKQVLEGSVTPEAWVHFLVSLLCHDIGFIRGICQGDNWDTHTFATGVNHTTLSLAPSATDASLMPYHVDRGKQFIDQTFGQHRLLDADQLKLNVELTRFPIPKDDLHQDTLNYPGLARVADLVGQLSDPDYLNKLPALFNEMTEVGSNRALNYNSPQDLRSSYPTFFNKVVCPHIEDGLRYLSATQQGMRILTRLYLNVEVVQDEQIGMVA